MSTMILVLPAIALAVACTTTPVVVVAPLQAPDLGQRFQLRVGESATVKGEALQVGFEAVASDSRCPKGVQCVRAGEAAIRISLTRGSGDSATRELRTAPARASETSFLDFRIRLLGLDPFPEANRQTRPEDYVATLIVEK